MGDGRWDAGGLCSITDRHAFLYTESMTMQTLTQGKKQLRRGCSWKEGSRLSVQDLVHESLDLRINGTALFGRLRGESRG